jgi:hypothetical protein
MDIVLGPFVCLFGTPPRHHPPIASWRDTAAIADNRSRDNRHPAASRPPSEKDDA